MECSCAGEEHDHHPTPQTPLIPYPTQHKHAGHTNNTPPHAPNPPALTSSTSRKKRRLEKYYLFRLVMSVGLSNNIESLSLINVQSSINCSFTSKLAGGRRISESFVFVSGFFSKYFGHLTK
jgi:hypothetical protein